MHKLRTLTPLALLLAAACTAPNADRYETTQNVPRWEWSWADIGGPERFNPRNCDVCMRRINFNYVNEGPQYSMYPNGRIINHQVPGNTPQIIETWSAAPQ